MWTCNVSKATHNVILKILIFQQYLIHEIQYYTRCQIKA